MSVFIFQNKNRKDVEQTSNVIVFLRFVNDLFWFVSNCSDVDGNGDGLGKISIWYLFSDKWKEDLFSLNDVNCVTSSSVVIGKWIFDSLIVGKYCIGICFNGVGDVLLRSDNELFDLELYADNIVLLLSSEDVDDDEPLE